jgi:hypothetical protein
MVTRRGMETEERHNPSVRSTCTVVPDSPWQENKDRGAKIFINQKHHEKDIFQPIVTKWGQNANTFPSRSILAKRRKGGKAMRLAHVTRWPKRLVGWCRATVGHKHQYRRLLSSTLLWWRDRNGTAVTHTCHSPRRYSAADA